MKKYLLIVITNPASQASMFLFGILILIGLLHNHAHYQMSNDPDAYVFQWCKANPERCTYRPK
jgi:sterol desaturase/sphingolipid hydroxylase (fatty acid hydroxylase superfamily)